MPDIFAQNIQIPRLLRQTAPALFLAATLGLAACSAPHQPAQGTPAAAESPATNEELQRKADIAASEFFVNLHRNRGILLPDGSVQVIDITSPKFTNDHQQYTRTVSGLVDRYEQSGNTYDDAKKQVSIVAEAAVRVSEGPDSEKTLSEQYLRDHKGELAPGIEAATLAIAVNGTMQEVRGALVGGADGTNFVTLASLLEVDVVGNDNPLIQKPASVAGSLDRFMFDDIDGVNWSQIVVGPRGSDGAVPAGVVQFLTQNQKYAIVELLSGTVCATDIGTPYQVLNPNAAFLGGIVYGALEWNGEMYVPATGCSTTVLLRLPPRDS